MTKQEQTHYSISQAAEILKVSRSTLLYYERRGLIKPDRISKNGYRRFSQDDLEKIAIIKQLQKADMTLEESVNCLEKRLDVSFISKKIEELDAKFEDLVLAKNLLEFLYFRTCGEKSPGKKANANLCKWHEEFDQRSTTGHLRFLKSMGFDEKQALYIKWLSKDMFDNEEYMEQFFWIFERMKRQGPGSYESTLKAFNALPQKDSIKNILDVGCGSGGPSLSLAQISKARIWALDNHKPFLAQLEKQALDQGVGDRITCIYGSMLNLPFEEASFDLIWSEGSSFVMGFSKALKEWKRFLKPKGYLMVTEAAWTNENPSKEVKEYWETAYPDMGSAVLKTEQALRAGYEVLDSFFLPHSDWQAYNLDMKEQLAKAKVKFKASKAICDLEEEVNIFEKFGKEYGYLCLVLAK